MDTNELRKASMAVYLATDGPVAKDLSDKLRGAADEIELLRKIADATKDLWDSGRLSLEDTHLKNLLTDYRADQQSVNPSDPSS